MNKCHVKSPLKRQKNNEILPSKLPVFAPSVKFELNPVGPIELWPVDRTPGVSHVLVVADMEQPACHTKSDDYTHVFK